MIHRDCGGKVEETWLKTYDYQQTDDCDRPVGKPVKMPALFCKKCSQEILGDAEIVLEPPELEELYPK